MDYSFPTAFIGAIGLLGAVCAIIAGQQLRAERRPLTKLEGFFLHGKGPLHSLAPNNLHSTRPVEWLRDQQIALESHAADYLLGVWGGWLAGRLPTLGELHSLSARRERARSSARWATGVATVLLVCGVAGTLLAIHPVLNDFTIQINSDGTVQDASKSAERVMSMIHQLGNSFYPSICAIGFTLLIVVLRSDYHRAAFRLGRALDRFAVDRLLPAFSLPTLGQEFAETQARLGSLADAVNRRDADFAVAVESLAGIVKDMRAVGPALSTAAKQVAAAATSLSTDATGIVNGLAKHLGSDGALVKSISGFKESVSRNQDAAKALTDASKRLEDTTRTLAGAVQYVPGALEKGCADGITEFNERARGAVNEAGRDMAASVGRALEESTAELREAARDLQSNSQFTQAEVIAGAAELSEVAARIEGSVDNVITRLTGTLDDEIKRAVKESVARSSPKAESVRADLGSPARIKLTPPTEPKIIPLSPTPIQTEITRHTSSISIAADDDTIPKRPWLKRIFRRK